MSNPYCGVRGHLRIECRADAARRTFLAKQAFRAPVHLSKPHWDGNHLIINVVNPTAGLFAGDQVELDVRVCKGASSVLTSPSAARVFRPTDSISKAQVTQSLAVEGGGRLDVFPEMLIPHAGARYMQTTRIDVQAGGELFFTEMIAPGRTASGEAFEYDQLEFGLDLVVSGELAVRECYRLAPRTEGVGAIRRDFPNAYYASAFIVSRRAVDDSLQRAVGALRTSRILAGASLPTKEVCAIKLVAADSMSLRAAVAGIRSLGYSYLGWPEPLLRKL
jgi:urease accessory protein